MKLKVETIGTKKVLILHYLDILYNKNSILSLYYGAPTRTRTSYLLITNQLACEVRLSLTVAAGFNNFTRIPVSQTVLHWQNQNVFPNPY